MRKSKRSESKWESDKQTAIQIVVAYNYKYVQLYVASATTPSIVWSKLDLGLLNPKSLDDVRFNTGIFMPLAPVKLPPLWDRKILIDELFEFLGGREDQDPESVSSHKTLAA